MRYVMCITVRLVRYDTGCTVRIVRCNMVLFLRCDNVDMERYGRHGMNMNGKYGKLSTIRYDLYVPHRTILTEPSHIACYLPHTFSPFYRYTIILIIPHRNVLHRLYPYRTVLTASSHTVLAAYRITPFSPHCTVLTVWHRTHRTLLHYTQWP